MEPFVFEIPARIGVADEHLMVACGQGVGMVDEATFLSLVVTFAATAREKSGGKRTSEWLRLGRGMSSPRAFEISDHRVLVSLKFMAGNKIIPSVLP